MTYRVLDLFSGIGGFSLGLERTGGFKTVAFAENSEYPRKVLNKHWPKVPIYEDVKNVTAKGLAADGIFPNVITGGFPCQDVSVAGRQEGLGEGTRSGLWSQCSRLIGEIHPEFAIFENVTGLLSGGGSGGEWFQRILWDISALGYDAEWECIPASSLGADHHRDRAWIIAYPCREGLQGREDAGIFGKGRKRWNELATRQLCSFGDISAIKPTICRSSDGIPNRSHRIKGLGNSLCPQIPELIGRAILES